MLSVDDREQRDHPQIFATLLKNLNHTNVGKVRLDYGDYTFLGAPYPQRDGTVRPPRIGIEYATLSDVLGKITSGRYGQQLTGMLTTYDVSILLIEGPVYAAKGSKNLQVFGAPIQFPKSRWDSIRFSTEMHGVRVFVADNRAEAAEWIIKWYRWWREDPEKHQLFRHREAEIQLDRAELSPDELPFDVPIGEPIDRAVSVMMAVVHGLGKKRVISALDKYGDLRTLFMLPESALREIDGWGPKLARDFNEAVTKRWNKT